MRLARARELNRFSGLGASEEESEGSMSISGVSWVLVKRACISLISLDWGCGTKFILDKELAVSSDSKGICAGDMAWR